MDDKLPTGEYEIFVIADYDFANPKPDQEPANKPRLHSGMKGMRINPQTQFRSQHQIQRNQTYRIKFLNGQFKSSFEKITFNYQVCVADNNCFFPNKSLNFTIIGSDSCLFEKPLRNNTVNVSSAERYEILITFDGNINN